MTVLRPHIRLGGVECRGGEGVEGTRLGVRVGLGYVLGVREDEVRQVVEEREQGGPYGDAGDLSARSGVGRDTLERLAWSGACDELPRREALWQMGVVTPGKA